MSALPEGVDLSVPISPPGTRVVWENTLPYRSVWHRKNGRKWFWTIEPYIPNALLVALYDDEGAVRYYHFLSTVDLSSYVVLCDGHKRHRASLCEAGASELALTLLVGD